MVENGGYLQHVEWSQGGALGSSRNGLLERLWKQTLLS